MSLCWLKNSRFFILFCLSSVFLFFFFNDTATTEIYTLSLHDALPISLRRAAARGFWTIARILAGPTRWPASQDRKSTRLNSSHLVISYAVFCLKKKKENNSKECLHVKHTTAPQQLQTSCRHRDQLCGT